MDGNEVFRFATRVMASATEEVLACAGLTIDQVQWIVPHQANIRIIKAAARGLKLPMERFIVNLERYGNTSTASIPMAMVEALEKGQIKPGEKIVMVGFGAGSDLGRPRRRMDWSDPEQGTCASGAISSLCKAALRCAPWPALYRRLALSPRTIIHS